MLHADLADISSTDIFNRGGKPCVGTTGSGGSVLRQCGIFLISFLFSTSLFAIEIPKESGRALGVTKGKPFSSGLVFVDGRYLPPPYVVERWGVGIRINSIPVIDSVIGWGDFLKTQSSASSSSSAGAESGVEYEMKEVEVEVEVEVEDDSAASETDSLDDLFDDGPSTKKTAKKKKTIKKKVMKKVPKGGSVSESASISAGAFVHNDASKALVRKINKVRTDINAMLISGGFICFGSNYSRVAGDRRICEDLLEKLPEIQKSCDSEAAFLSAVRAANLVYITEPLAWDLFRNRRDYLRLQQRREKEKESVRWRKLGLDGI